MSDTPNNGRGESLWLNGTPTTSELLEAAVFDALGLLDERDAEAYAQALESAPAELRAAVLDEQARLSVADELLADVEAPAALRDRVLAAVHDAIEAGRLEKVSSASSDVTSDTASAVPSSTPRRHDAGRAVPKMTRARRVHPAWRAATVGLAVAVVSLAVVQVQLQGDYRAFQSEASIARLIEAIGVAHIRDTLLDPSTERHAMQALPAAAGAEAAVWTNPDWDEARLYCYQLPRVEGASFRVVELTDAGDIGQTLAVFPTSGLLDAVSIPLDAGRTGTMTVAVVMDSPSGVTQILRTDIRLA